MAAAGSPVRLSGAVPGRFSWAINQLSGATTATIHAHRENMRSIIRRARRRLYTLAGMQRRTFLMASSLATPVMAEDSIRAGVIGAGGRGRYLIEQFKEGGAQMAAVCDVYEPKLKKGLAGADSGAASFSDPKTLLEHRSLASVVIAQQAV